MIPGTICIVDLMTVPYYMKETGQGTLSLFFNLYFPVEQVS